ncbi:PD-(D/E)XK nuclease family protein [Acidovorax radicis]|uniref:PDDEXK-like family protein n=1 Tax=Acidovorax radicis TaxID=758826 RepID=UPI001CFAC55A|nr:PD-(D/E)XK nuclease family protein [Acidovorax radicis]UCV00880.1 PD-(D/E)XK nuclease family protein [Acidovorax radicis]
MIPPLNPDLAAITGAQLHPVRDILNEVIALQGRQKAQETRRARELLQHPLVHDLVLTEKVRRRLTGERHNIFEALGVAHKENYHSRFIGYLFNPSSEHDQGDAFLRGLLKWAALQIDLSSAVRESISAYLSRASHRANAKITTEQDAGEYGRVDLVIELPDGTTIAIENKVYAGEQDRQLSRYWQWLRSRPGRAAEQAALIFLTPDGRAGTTAAARDIVVCMSYADLANVLEQGAAACPATALPLIQSVSQYTHLCRSIAIGSAPVTKPNPEIQELLESPAQLEAAFMLAEQLEEKKKAIPRDFALHVVELLNQRLQAASLYQKPWVARLEADNGLLFGIGIDGAFGDHSKCVAEAWNGTLIGGWRKAYENQGFADDALRVEMTQKLAGKSDSWWLCWTSLSGPAREAGSAVAGSTEGLLFLHEDNRDPTHPNAQRLAQELWTFFAPFQERMSALYCPSDDALPNG